MPQRFKTLRLILPEGFLKGANMAQADSKVLRLGVDVGSTTVKTVVLDPNTNGVLFTLSRTGIVLRTLSSYRKTDTMSDSSVTTNIHQSFDVHLD